MARQVIRFNLHETIGVIKKAFLAGVDAVQPHRLIAKFLKQENNKLIINGTPHDLQRNVYVVGFGKAVGDMVDPVVTLLKTPDSVSHLQRGIISVPHGYQAKRQAMLDAQTERIDIRDLGILEGKKDEKGAVVNTQLGVTANNVEVENLNEAKDVRERTCNTHTDGITESTCNTQTEGITGSTSNGQVDRINTSTPQVEILEGAKDNIPDEAAFQTAKKIVSLVQSLKEEDLLLVLISGGGSALLPYPLPPLSLEEKIELVKSLSQAGASITELNTVRRALSYTKGGRLAEMTGASIVTFILSDVINNPLDVIATGPTIPNMDPPGDALKVLDKFNIAVPDHVRTLLEGKNQEKEYLPVKKIKTGNVEIPDQVSTPLRGKNEGKNEYPHVTNLIIGDNKTALLGVERSLLEQTDGHCLTLILSSSLQGEASIVGKRMANLAMITLRILSGSGNEKSSGRNRELTGRSQEGNEGSQETAERCKKVAERSQEIADSCQELPDSLLAELCVDVNKKASLQSTLVRCRELGCPVCLIFGGETTVTVRGKGRGGRNQEMVLAAGIAMEEVLCNSDVQGGIVFLSGGTDGIDGPTDAAGAVTFWSHHNGSVQSQIQEAQNQGLSAQSFLDANNSYPFFSQLGAGLYHLKPGHTGTNVMDLQVLYIRPW